MTTANKKIKFSKKFFMLLFSVLLVTGLLITALVTQSFGWPMAAFMCIGIIIIAVMAIAYVFNQATLDTFIEAISAGVGHLPLGETNKEETESEE